jgi:hypothetical protein
MSIPKEQRNKTNRENILRRRKAEFEKKGCLSGLHQTVGGEAG